MCENQGMFQVEDLPVGTRQFCSEKCFAQYTGLPIQNEGFYGLSKSSTDVPQQQNAENKGKNTINPIERAGISGMASGATMEGLSALMGAEEPPEKDDPLESWMEDYDAEESDPHPSLYWFVKGEIMEMLKHGDMTQTDLERIVEIVATKAPLYMIDRGMNMAEKLGDRPVWEVLKLSAITRIEIEEMDDDAVFSEKLGDWASEGWSSEYVLLGTMQSTPADGYNGYMKMMRDARRLVEIGNETGLDQKLGEAYQDESGRWFLPILERKASEDEETSFDSLKSYFAQLKNQNPDLARKIEYSVKNEDDIPRKEIEEAGFDEDIIEEWVDYIAVQDDNLQPYETCPACEGEGWILTSYTPATRYDPADGDGEDCEECVGTGLIDPADYMDKQGEYYAETFESPAGYCPECGGRMVAECQECYHTMAESFEAEEWNKEWNWRTGRTCPYSDCYTNNPYQMKALGIPLYKIGRAEIEEMYNGNLYCHCCARTVDYEYAKNYTPSTDYSYDNAPTYLRILFDDYMRGYDRKTGTYGDEPKPFKPFHSRFEEWAEKTDKEYRAKYGAESFEADTNGDRQLEESIKRTKMSAIRTGLAITTFGIVLWNLWTNKKQEKQISDIMGLV